MELFYPLSSEAGKDFIPYLLQCNKDEKSSILPVRWRLVKGINFNTFTEIEKNALIFMWDKKS